MNKLLSLLLLSSAFLHCPEGRAQPDQITLFIPAFEGPGELGKNVATVLNLKIWSTLRRKPWPNNPHNLDFGKGLVIWDPQPLPSQSYQQAEDLGKDINILAQVVLWGKAYPYGDGVVVQANVSIPKYRDFREYQNEQWRITIAGEQIIADIPRRRFELPAIVLTQQVIDSYSLPSALKIYSSREGGDPIGYVGSSYLGVQFETQRSLAKVVSNDTTGWVRLPHLSKQPSSVSDFVGGLLKVFRGDWEGVQIDMKKVIENPNTSAPLRIDAYLYQGLALEKQGQSGILSFEQAVDLNPYSTRSVRYLLMSQLSDISGAKDRDEAIALIAIAEASVKRYQKLFAEDNPWMKSVRSALDSQKRALGN